MTDIVAKELDENEIVGPKRIEIAQVPTRVSGMNLGDRFRRVKINERNRCEVGGLSAPARILFLCTTKHGNRIPI